MRPFKPYVDRLVSKITHHGRFKIFLDEGHHHLIGIVQSQQDKQRRILHDSVSRCSYFLTGDVFGSDSEDFSDGLEAFQKAYQQKDKWFSKQLHGYFLAMVFDKRKQEWILGNDRLGLYPTYWTEQKDALLLSSEPELFSSVGLTQPHLDFDGLAELFLIGFPIGKRTLLRDVWRCRPGTVFVLDGQNLRKRSEQVLPRCFKREFTAGKPGAAYADADFLFKRSIKRGGDYWIRQGHEYMELALSGGLDSRLILAHMLRLNIPVKAVTCYDPHWTHPDDIKYAKDIADHFGFLHEIYTKVSGQSLSFPNLLQTGKLSKVPEMSGFAAEIIKDKYGPYLQDVDNRVLGENMLREIFSENFVSNLTQHPHETAQREWNLIDHDSEVRRKEIFYLEHLGSFFKREMSPLHRPKYLFLHHSYYPFLDADFLQYVLSLPVTCLSKGEFFLSWVRRLYPEFYAIPSTTRDRIVPAVRSAYRNGLNHRGDLYAELLENFRQFSPLWSLNIFSGSFRDDETKIAACLFNVWHDYHFGYESSVEQMKKIIEMG